MKKIFWKLNWIRSTCIEHSVTCSSHLVCNSASIHPCLTYQVSFYFCQFRDGMRDLNNDGDKNITFNCLRFPILLLFSAKISSDDFFRLQNFISNVDSDLIYFSDGDERSGYFFHRRYFLGLFFQCIKGYHTASVTVFLSSSSKAAITVSIDEKYCETTKVYLDIIGSGNKKKKLLIVKYNHENFFCLF